MAYTVPIMGLSPAAER